MPKTQTEDYWVSLTFVGADKYIGCAAQQGRAMGVNVRTGFEIRARGFPV